MQLASLVAVPEGGLVEFQGWRVPGVYPCRLSLAGGGEEPDAAADFSVMYNLDLTGLEVRVCEDRWARVGREERYKRAGCAE